jgi:hypothetical protein
MQHSTQLWTVAYTQTGSEEVIVAVVGACNREDAAHRSLDVLGPVTIVWVEPLSVATAA